MLASGVEDDLRDAVGARSLRMLRFALGGAALLALMLALALAAFGAAPALASCSGSPRWCSRSRRPSAA